MTHLVRWDPFADFEDLQKRVFGTSHNAGSIALAKADVYVKEGQELVGEFQIPGFSEDEIDISVNDGFLEIRAQREDKQSDKSSDGKRYIVRELSNSFYRSIALPKQADTAGIEAHFDNGLLQVTVPFAEPAQPKKITVKKRTSPKSQAQDTSTDESKKTTK